MGVKTNTTLKDIPVILLTQLTEPEDIIEGLNAGADNYITKPYNKDFLLSRVKHLLEYKRENGNSSDGVIEVYFGGKKHIIFDLDQIKVLEF